MLKAVCASCRQALRDFDLFARMGGDEFAALLPNTELEETEQTAERLRQRVMEQHVTIENAMFALATGITLGPACAPATVPLLPPSPAAGEAAPALLLAPVLAVDAVRWL